MATTWVVLKTDGTMVTVEADSLENEGGSLVARTARTSASILSTMSPGTWRAAWPATHGPGA